MHETSGNSGEPADPLRGVGLGLTVVRRVIELLGGDVLVGSTPGEGSRFTVRLRLEVPEIEGR